MNPLAASKKVQQKSNFIGKENSNRMTHILVELEIDKDLIGEMSFSLKESRSEKERFSSSMFNLKHFFGNKNRLANVFEMKLANVFICEPFQYKLTHLNADQFGDQNCFLGFEIENILSTNVRVEIVDSDVLIELSPELINGKFVKIHSNLVELIDYVIYNKNKVVSLSSFEKSNLLGRLSIRGDRKTDDKFRRVVESCHFCLKKSQIINEKSVSRFSKKDGESLLFSITAPQTGTTHQPTCPTSPVSRSTLQATPPRATVPCSVGRTRPVRLKWTLQGFCVRSESKRASANVSMPSSISRIRS